MPQKGKALCKYAILGAMAFVIFSLLVADAALLPPDFLNCVVALGSINIRENGQFVEWLTEGTGFFYGYLVKDDPSPEKRQYETYLVTAKHVIQGHPATRGDLFVRVNPNESSSSVEKFPVPIQSLSEANTWFFHPDSNVDLAVIGINIPMLRERGFQSSFFSNDQAAANTDKLKSLGVAAGDGVFVLGFPMGLTGVQRNYVIVRQGAIARISEMLDHASRTFLVDAFVFPGNSGGPVVLRPEISSITGTKSQSAAYLMGIVLNYTPYIDIAFSLQTHRPRVTFEENSGLAEILPTDYIDAAIKARREKNNPVDSPTP